MAPLETPLPPRRRVEWQRPHLYKKQLDAIFTTARYAIIEASTKSGKTVGCLTWLIEQAVMGKDGRNYWWVAPSFRQAAIAFRRAKGGLSRDTFSSNDTNLMLKLCNGAMIWFISGEIPDNLYGEDVYACVIDEASRLREAAWHAIRSTLTATRGPIRIIGNVKGRKSWFYKLARKAEAGEPDMHFSRIQAKDAVAAGVLAAEEIADAKSKLPDNVFKELYEAEPGDDSGNPFGLEAIRKCTQLMSLTTPICYGVDLAKSTDWTVIIGLDEAGNCCYYERFQRPWLETVKRIKDVVGHTQCLMDSTGVGDAVVEFIQRNYGSNFEGFKFSATSKQQLMEGLTLAVQGSAITFPQEVADEMEEFEYTYTRTGVFYSAPEGLHDDCVCALALANQKLNHLTGAMGLLRHYQNMAQAANAETKPEKAPGIRPVPPKPVTEVPSPVKAYQETLAKMELKDVCCYCGGSLDAGRCTDGYKSWCQPCNVPDWVRAQRAATLPNTCDVTFPEAST